MPFEFDTLYLLNEKTTIIIEELIYIWVIGLQQKRRFECKQAADPPCEESGPVTTEGAFLDGI